MASSPRAAKTANASVTEIQGKHDALVKENESLKQTAQFFFDAAVKKSQGADTPEKMQAAITAFEVVTSRFPGDPLAEVAGERIGVLQEGIEANNKRLAGAQKELRKLIAACRSYSKKARAMDGGGMRFVGPNQTMDLNLAMAHSRRQDAVSRKATVAKEKAEKLLKSDPDPDPDGSLAKEVDECDD